jgi:triacylglycerol esterase/lipase EstA (alpha/beta hydrolase family)
MLSYSFRRDEARRAHLVRRMDRAATLFAKLVGDATLLAREMLPWEHTARRRAPEDQNPLITVHGLGADVGSLGFLVRILELDGWHVFPVELDTLGHRVETLALKLGRHVERVLRRTGRSRVDLIGHSLGGLVIRYYIQMLEGHKRTDRCITIGTPHSGGTIMSYFLPPLRALGYLPEKSRGKAADQLLPGSGLYEHLNGPVFRVENVDHVDFTNVWSLTDELIVPSWNARFAQATREQMFVVKGHVGLVLSASVLRYVADTLLAAPTPRRPASASS